MLGKQADQMLPMLLGNFLQDGVRLLSSARQALAESRANDLCRAAHSLKSAAATFGAMALSAVAKELEMLTKPGTLEGAETLIARGEEEFARAKTALEQAQKGGTA